MAQKLGVIGTGFAWDRLHYPAIKQLGDQYEIAAVCNKTIDKAQGFAQGIGLAPENVYSDYRELLARPDIDVVDVLVPISENYEVAKDVLLAGKDLIAEKPFASTPEAAQELIDLKNRQMRKVLVAENYRYDEGNTIIKDIITSGQIGEVFSFLYSKGANFEADMLGDTFAAKEWRQHPTFPGGIFLDGGIHDIALMRYLFGEVAQVSAQGRPQTESYCPYRCITALLRFDSGIIGTYCYDSKGTEPIKPPVGLRIYGTLGSIYLESSTCGTIQICYNDGRSEQRSFTPGRGYYNELLNFYQGDILSTPEKELGDIELIHDILAAIQEDAAQEWL